MSNYEKYTSFIETAKRVLVLVSDINEKKQDFGIRKIFIREIMKILKGKITREQLWRDTDELGLLLERAKKTHRERYNRKPRAVCCVCHREIKPEWELYTDGQDSVYCSEFCITKKVKCRKINPNDREYNKFVKQSIENYHHDRS